MVSLGLKLDMVWRNSSRFFMSLSLEPSSFLASSDCLSSASVPPAFQISNQSAMAVVVEEKERVDDVSDIRSSPPENKLTPMTSSPKIYLRQPSPSRSLTLSLPLC